MESESVEGVAKSCGAKTKRQGEKRGEERGSSYVRQQLANLRPFEKSDKDKAVNT